MRMIKKNSELFYFTSYAQDVSAAPPWGGLAPKGSDVLRSGEPRPTLWGVHSSQLPAEIKLYCSCFLWAQRPLSHRCCWSAPLSLYWLTCWQQDVWRCGWCLRQLRLLHFRRVTSCSGHRNTNRHIQEADRKPESWDKHLSGFRQFVPSLMDTVKM